MKAWIVVAAIALAGTAWMARWTATNAINVGGKESVYVLDRWTGRSMLVTGNEAFDVMSPKETIHVNRAITAPSSAESSKPNAWGDIPSPK